MKNLNFQTSKLIGKVESIDGKYIVIKPNGTQYELSIGSTIEIGDRIVGDNLNTSLNVIRITLSNGSNFIVHEREERIFSESLKDQYAKFVQNEKPVLKINIKDTDKTMSSTIVDSEIRDLETIVDKNISDAKKEIIYKTYNIVEGEKIGVKLSNINVSMSGSIFLNILNLNIPMKDIKITKIGGITVDDTEIDILSNGEVVGTAMVVENTKGIDNIRFTPNKYYKNLGLDESISMTIDYIQSEKEALEAIELNDTDNKTNYLEHSKNSTDTATDEAFNFTETVINSNESTNKIGVVSNIFDDDTSKKITHINNIPITETSFVTINDGIVSFIDKKLVFNPNDSFAFQTDGETRDVVIPYTIIDLAGLSLNLTATVKVGNILIITHTGLLDSVNTGVAIPSGTYVGITLFTTDTNEDLVTYLLIPQTDSTLTQAEIDAQFNIDQATGKITLNAKYTNSNDTIFPLKVVVTSSCENTVSTDISITLGGRGCVAITDSKISLCDEIICSENIDKKDDNTTASINNQNKKTLNIKEVLAVDSTLIDLMQIDQIT